MEQDKADRRRVRVVQMLYLALMGGVFTFGSLSFVLRSLGSAAGSPPASPGIDPLVLAVLSVSGTTLVMSVILPRVIEGATRRQWEGQPKNEAAAEALFARWQTLMILRGALLEGAALMGVVVYFLNGSTITLAAAAVGLALMIGAFPSSAGLTAFVERVLGRR